MSQLNDAKYAALIGHGIEPGQINDMEHQWLSTLLVEPQASLADSWKQLLLELGYDTARPDAMLEFLHNLNFFGARPEAELAWWEAGAPIPGPGEEPF